MTREGHGFTLRREVSLGHIIAAIAFVIGGIGTATSVASLMAVMQKTLDAAVETLERHTETIHDLELFRVRQECINELYAGELVDSLLQKREQDE